LYPCPDTRDQRQELQRQVTERIADMENVMTKTNEYRRRVFRDIGDNLDNWQTFLKHEKAIYLTMNLFNWDVTSKCLIAEGWCPTSDISEIKKALQRATETSGSNVPTILNVLQTRATPPTFHRTNKFTDGFQTIVDAYGVASYREVNPAPFSLISFPFLFAVMFGDIGHGFLMTLVALYLVIKEKQLAKADYGEIFETLFGGRYIVLLMGIFSIYTGLVYNDIFSRGLAIFGKSGWEFEQVEGINNSYVGTFTGHVYPLGLDPGWHGADNYLIFTNSYKMKMSVIFGVVQMTFGLILSLLNHLYFKKMVSVYHEFIPQMIFLQSIFGYLTFTIIYKWCQNWDVVSPPSLLNMLIYMFLSPGRIDEQLYSGQSTVQIILLVMALISVPWMLLVKPLYLAYKHKSQYQQVHDNSASPDEPSPDEPSPDEPSPESDHDDEHGEFEFGEVMVHQVIHTIEFCLGAISNTASYLRLWALSLAHAQLSTVLWQMTLGLFLTQEGVAMQAIGLFIGFGGWFALTIGILLIMEGLSAFLHALRLHWVEFNNKFYSGNGVLFKPFSFDRRDDDD
jgi:V-type H+-transporting ATPase subunit a